MERVAKGVFSWWKISEMVLFRNSFVWCSASWPFQGCGHVVDAFQGVFEAVDEAFVIF